MTKRNLIIAIPVVAIILNGLGYLIFSKARTPPTTAVSDSAVGRPPRGPSGDNAKPAERTADVPNVQAEEERAREAQAQARRASGLAALEAGNYDKALIYFTEAKSLIGDQANVGDLLKVTEDLRRRPPALASLPAPAEFPARRKAASSPSRRVAAREQPDVESAPPPQPSAPSPPGGLLIVTTTPRGMLVHIDDAPVDLTPMKAKVKPGSHRVTLLDGDRKVYETTVEVKDGATATLLRDLTAERVADAPRPVAAAPTSPAPVREDTRPSSEPPAPATPARGTLEPAKEAEARTDLPNTGGQMGILEITSPGLYGVVWVNGRPRGYPPLAVRDLPPGPVKVEVRVNGVQKRVATVTVKAGLTTSIKLRATATSQ